MGNLALWLSERCPATFRELFTSSGPALLSPRKDSLQILTHSVTGRTLELLLKNFCDIRPVANSISTTQFHLRKLSKWNKFLRYYFPRHYKLNLISYSKGQQVFNTYALILDGKKAVIFPKLTEIYVSRSTMNAIPTSSPITYRILAGNGQYCIKR